MNMIKHHKLFFGLSGAVILAGILAALILGINFGIDFTGGTMIQIDLHEQVSLDAIGELLAPFDLEEEVVHAGEERQEIIIKTRLSLDNAQRMEIFSVFQAAYNLADEDFLGAEQFGPTIGGEIQQRALFAVLAAAVCMLVYIWFRFELMFGFAAILALVHDVAILLAIYSIFRVPVNSSFIAAVLTIVGYSINDTIVVFDRIRENLYHTKGTFFDIADLSVRQTLSRSINTSLTTALVIGSLYFLGLESIRDFAFPLFAGVIVGTYSSIFIASPTWALLRTRFKPKRA